MRLSPCCLSSLNTQLSLRLSVLSDSHATGQQKALAFTVWKQIKTRIDLLMSSTFSLLLFHMILRQIAVTLVGLFVTRILDALLLNRSFISVAKPFGFALEFDAVEYFNVRV